MTHTSQTRLSMNLLVIRSVTVLLIGSNSFHSYFIAVWLVSREIEIVMTWSAIMDILVLRWKIPLHLKLLYRSFVCTRFNTEYLLYKK